MQRVRGAREIGLGGQRYARVADGDGDAFERREIGRWLIMRIEAADRQRKYRRVAPTVTKRQVAAQRIAADLGVVQAGVEERQLLAEVDAAVEGEGQNQLRHDLGDRHRYVS